MQFLHTIEYNFNLENKEEWSIGCPFEVMEAAKQFCKKHNILYKDYGRIMLDPSRIKGDLSAEFNVNAEDDLDSKSIDELATMIAQKKVKNLLKKTLTDLD